MEKKQRIQPAFNSIQEVLELISPANISLLETGFKVFDDTVGGLEQFTVLGAPPGSGKSIFAANIYCHNALNGVPVLLFDYENPIQAITNRILSIISGISADRRNAHDQATEKYSEGKYLEEFKRFRKNFYLKKNEPFNLDKIKRYVEDIRHDTKQDKILIILDSLQEHIPTDNLSDRRAGVDKMLREIEELISSGVWVLVISEYRRNYTQGKGVSYDNSSVASFKESGGIEYSARMALALQASREQASDGSHTNLNLELFMLKENYLAIGGVDNHPVARLMLKYPCVRLQEVEDVDTTQLSNKEIRETQKVGRN
jgi:replicative DNA helicase